MANLYQITQNLAAIFAEIEDNEGELTPELEEQLNVNQENYISKLENYAKIIANYNSEINGIKEEVKRLNTRKKSFEKTIERLEKIMTKAVKDFGPVKTTLFDIKLRNSKSIAIDENRINSLNCNVIKFATDMYQNGYIDFGDSVDIEGMLDAINANLKAEAESDEKDFIPFTIEDLKVNKIEIGTTDSIYDLFNSRENLIKYVLDNQYKIKIESDLDKARYKHYINNIGNVTIADIQENQKLSIK